MRLWRRLADWACPPEAVTDVGRVYWKLRFPAVTRRADHAAIYIPLQMSMSVVELSRWVRWPSMDEWMQTEMRRHARLVEERLTRELRLLTGDPALEVEARFV